MAYSPIDNSVSPKRSFRALAGAALLSLGLGLPAAMTALDAAAGRAPAAVLPDVAVMASPIVTAYVPAP